MFESQITIEVETYIPKWIQIVWWAARYSLCDALGIDMISNVRDVDYMSDKSIDPYSYERLQKLYWTTDIEQTREIWSNYFHTRDFTINEVIAYSDKIILSPVCRDDTVGKIIKLSPNEDLWSRQWAKWTRLSLVSDWEYQFDQIDDEVEEINEFELWLQLYRAKKHSYMAYQNLWDSISEKFDIRAPADIIPFFLDIDAFNDLDTSYQNLGWINLSQGTKNLIHAYETNF